MHPTVFLVVGAVVALLFPLQWVTSWCRASGGHSTMLAPDKVYLMYQSKPVSTFGLTYEATYNAFREGIEKNAADLDDAVVIDVGAGTGLLSWASLKAGARKVYAIEGSEWAETLRKNIHEHNGVSSKQIEVVSSMAAEAALPEQADVVMGQLFGNAAVFGRGLEQLLIVRDRYLKPGGKVFPTSATINVRLSTESADSVLAMGTALWLSSPDTKQLLHGYDTSLYGADAEKHAFGPTTGTFSPYSAKKYTATAAAGYTQNYRTMTLAELQNFVIPLEFPAVKQACTIHQLGISFDFSVAGSGGSVDAKGVNLPQFDEVILPLEHGVEAKEGVSATGTLHFDVSTRHGYGLKLELEWSSGQRTVQSWQKDDVNDWNDSGEDMPYEN